MFLVTLFKLLHLRINPFYLCYLIIFAASLSRFPPIIDFTVRLTGKQTMIALIVGYRVIISNEISWKIIFYSTNIYKLR